MSAPSTRLGLLACLLVSACAEETQHPPTLETLTAELTQLARTPTSEARLLDVASRRAPLFVEALAAGTHQLELAAFDGSGNRTTARTTVVISPWNSSCATTALAPAVWMLMLLRRRLSRSAQ